MKVLADALPFLVVAPDPPRPGALERRAPAPPVTEEAALCASALRGDTEAWSALVHKHNHRVVVTLLARGIRIDRAKDIAQEAWIRLVEQQRQGRLDRLQLPGLAIAQATFLALEACRREATARRHDPIDEPAVAAALADPRGDAESRMITEERVARAIDVLGCCSPSAREVFRLAYGGRWAEPRRCGQARRVVAPAGATDSLRSARPTAKRVGRSGGRMTGRHATSAELELYVMGALDGGSAEWLEVHAATCEVCASALAHEANLEMAFEQVSKRATRTLGVLRAAGYGGAGLVAVAAGLLLWIGRGSAPVAGESASSSAVHAHGGRRDSRRTQRCVGWTADRALSTCPGLSDSLALRHLRDAARPPLSTTMRRELLPNRVPFFGEVESHVVEVVESQRAIFSELRADVDTAIEQARQKT